MAWASATFAFLADLAMGTLGGDLKRKEKLTGRFADIFTWMYIGTAVLRRFEAEGRRAEDLPFLHWSMQYAFARMQEAFDGLFANLRVPFATWLFRGPVAAWSRFNRLSPEPSDAVGGKVAAVLLTPGAQRDRLFGGVYTSADPTHTLGRFETAMAVCAEAEAVAGKIKDAVRAKQLPREHPAKLVPMAVEKGIITSDEAALVARAEAARTDAIQVDSFSPDEYFATAATPLASGDGAGDGTRSAPPVPAPSRLA
jgi:acyl-CoA dehydrogenase